MTFDKLSLKRFAYGPMGTFGRLELDGFSCFTVECPWSNNTVDLSCIPIGSYFLKLGKYTRGGYPAYELQDVENRSLIKIHAGNTVSDIRGCIALGEHPGCIGNQWAVINSRNTFKKFMDAMDGVPEALLTISNVWDYSHAEN